MDFQRARSEEQREHRRRVILETAATMLDEMPVSALSLNELSRRVGLAKSNVLRYFESREAVLLELLDAELAAWTAAVDATVQRSTDSLPRRIDAVANAVATTLSSRATLCDLISSQASVLERNVSTAVVLQHKKATAASVSIVISALRRALPELDEEQTYRIVAVTLLMTAAIWPHSRPSEALQAAFDADPAVAATQLDITEVLQTSIIWESTGAIATAHANDSDRLNGPGAAT